MRFLSVDLCSLVFRVALEVQYLNLFALNTAGHVLTTIIRDLLRSTP